MLEIRIDKLDGRAFARALRKAVTDAQGDIAKRIRARHRQLLNAGQAPDGSPQPKNAPGWSQKKGGKPMGVDTGRLRSKLRTRTKDRGARRVIEPPADRLEPLRRLRERGFRTIFDELPDGLEQEAQDAVDGHVGQVDPQRFVRRGRWFGR